MNINHIFTTCANIEYHAKFVVFDNVLDYTVRERELYRGEWEWMADHLAKAPVAKFSVEDGGDTVYVWVVLIK